MSMLSEQIKELRNRASVLRQGDWSDGEEDALLLEEAAHSIEFMRDKLQADVLEPNTLKERTEYLLEHLRTCGEYKCTECLYSLRVETHLGDMYDCKHPGTLRHKGHKDRADVMRGSACCWFEPMAHAGEYVARRNADQRDVWRKVLDYAERHTEWTPTGESNDERQLARLKSELRDLGVMGV